jgi:hypothetical protein
MARSEVHADALPLRPHSRLLQVGASSTEGSLLSRLLHEGASADGSRPGYPQAPLLVVTVDGFLHFLQSPLGHPVNRRDRRGRPPLLPGSLGHKIYHKSTQIMLRPWPWLPPPRPTVEERPEFCANKSACTLGYSSSHIVAERMQRQAASQGSQPLCFRLIPAFCGVYKQKQTPCSLVRERTIPTDRPPLVDEI